MGKLSIITPANIVEPDFVIKVEKLLENMDFIEDLISQQVEADNIEAISEMLQELSSWYSMSTNIVSSAKFYNDLAYKQEYERTVESIKKKNLPTDLKGITSPSVLKDYLKSRIAPFNALLERAERQNRGLTHRIDALRSLLSKEKEVYRQTYQGIKNQ